MLSEVKKPLLLSSNTFPVVGIGASAGGLDAFVRLLKAIPVDSGMAYVLVQHLDPNHKSILPAARSIRVLLSISICRMGILTCLVRHIK